MHCQENTLFDIDPNVKGSRSHEMLPSTIDIMGPMHQQSLMLLHPMFYEKMRLQENTLFDIDTKFENTGSNRNLEIYDGNFLWRERKMNK